MIPFVASLKHAIHRVRWRLQKRQRNLYLESIKVLVLNSLYEPGAHLDEGAAWPPSKALTMIGRKRLDHLQLCLDKVIKNNVPGDLIETGIWKGGAVVLMRAMLEGYQIKDRAVYAADSFRGIPPANPEKYPADAAHIGCHTLEILANNSQAEVEGYFQHLGLLDHRVVFVPGWFRETLPLLDVRKIALLRLDGDIYESTWDALVSLYPKLSPGGYVIIDDYEAYSGCKQAVHDYREKFQITEKIETIDWTGVFWKKEFSRES
jgi:hypothetical protein